MSGIQTKLYFDDQIRRITLAQNSDFKSFLETVKQFCPKKLEDGSTFTYVDEEGEEVTFSTEFEFKEVLKQDPKKILRISIKNPREKRREEKEKRREEKKDDKEKKREEKRCPKFVDLGFPLKQGDYVVDLAPQDISKFLATGCVDLSNYFGRHKGIVCDGCNNEAFKGKRYQCKNCQDFDFCEPCFKGKYSQHFGGKHLFKEIELKTPKDFGKIETHIINEEVKPTAPKLSEIKVESKKEVKIEPVIIQPKIEVPKVEVKVESPKQEKVVEVPKVEVKVESKPQKDDKFTIHYKILDNMGFKNVDLCTFLLNKHQGNLQKVVDELLLSQ